MPRTRVAGRELTLLLRLGYMGPRWWREAPLLAGASGRGLIYEVYWLGGRAGYTGNVIFGDYRDGRRDFATLRMGRAVPRLDYRGGTGVRAGRSPIAVSRIPGWRCAWGGGRTEAVRL